MIKLSRGKATQRPYKKAASTVFALNDVVTKNSSGLLVRATSATPKSEVIGLIQRDVVSTDADYASESVVNVQIVGLVGQEFNATVDTGTLTQAMVGEAVSLADHNGINVNDNLGGQVKILRYISATEAIVEFLVEGKTNYALKSYTQTFTRAQMIDGGSTAGTLDLSTTIPAGAVFLQSILTSLTGFTGDTSATIIVGVTGGDTDRYSTGTPSVFTTAAAGIDLGVPSGTKWHTAAAVPTVLITSAADFTNVTAGQATITLLWHEAV